MKCKKLIMSICILMIVGTNSLVYAKEVNIQNQVVTREQNSVTQSQSENESLAQLYHKAGLDSPEVILNTLTSLGISNEELKAAINEGIKIYDLLQQKNITVDEFKKALSKEYNIRIKQAVKDKIITKEEGTQLKKLLKERMSRWKTKK